MKNLTTFHLNVGRFYKIPYLSITDAIYPAFTRHYIQQVMSDRWKYSQFGCHLTEIGWKYVTIKITVPFLITIKNNFNYQNIAKDLKNLKHNKDVRYVYDHIICMHYDNQALEFRETWDLLVYHERYYSLRYEMFSAPTGYWNHEILPNYVD